MGEPGFGTTAHTFAVFFATIAMGSAAQTFTLLVRFDQTDGMDRHKSLPVRTGTSAERGATVDAMGTVCLLALTPTARVLVLSPTARGIGASLVIPRKSKLRKKGGIPMNSRKCLGAVLVTLTLLLLTPFATAVITACDNYGQDWQLTLGAFGGTFPGTQIVSGCRDCDASLGCGGSLSLDGALVRGTGGLIFSTTAYNPVGGSCFSTHWTGVLTPGTSISGNVSNDAGPFGPFTITPGACVAGSAASADPAHSTRGTWELPQ